MATASNSRTCQICAQHQQRYSCPRCNILYCSVDCYKDASHAQCSEAFFKDCVVEEMSMLGKRLPAGIIDNSLSSNGDNAKVQQMYDILKRNAGETGDYALNGDVMDDDDEQEGAFGYDADAEEDVEELDSDDEIDLADRLNGIDLDDANAVWECLTTAERKDFENVVHSEHVTKLSVREPWWRKWEIDGEKCSPIIEDITDPSAARQTTEHPIAMDYDPTAVVVDDMPPILDRIADFSILSGGKSPAAGIEHNIKNVIGAYCLTYRFYYGDPISHASESCTYLFSRSGNLRSNAIYKSTESAMLDVNPNGDPNLLQLISDDTDTIWLGPPLPEPRPRQERITATQAALSDVHRLLSAARTITLKTIPVPVSSAFDGAKAKAELNAGLSTDAGSCDASAKRIPGRVIANGAPVSRVFLSACLKKIEYYLSAVQQLQ